MNILKETQDLLNLSCMRSPDESIENFIYESFLASKNIGEFYAKVKKIDKRCSLKNVLVYFESFKYFEACNAL